MQARSTFWLVQSDEWFLHLHEVFQRPQPDQVPIPGRDRLFAALCSPGTEGALSARSSLESRVVPKTSITIVSGKYIYSELQ